MKKQNFIVENYKKSFRFLREIKWHFVLSTGIFFLLFLIGFAFPIFFKEQILNLITQLAGSIEGKSWFGLIVYIFLNNLRSSFFAMIFGIVFGIFPLITLIINGYLLGFVGRLSVDKTGILTLWKIFPHGIFELPAILLSTAIGIKIGTDIFRKKRRTVWENYKEGLRFFICVVVPLLIIAAIIEGSLIWLLK